jgi:hypothetical protein
MGHRSYEQSKCHVWHQFLLFSINALHISTFFAIIILIEYHEIEVGLTRVDAMRYEGYR